MDSLPRLSIALCNGYVIASNGCSIEIYEKNEYVGSIKLFEDSGTHIYGIYSDEDGIIVHGERALCFVNNINIQEKNAENIIIHNLPDHILSIKTLQNSQLALLFISNVTCQYSMKRTKDFQLELVLSVQSSHRSTLMKAILMGDRWEDLYTIVGTVMGDILVSRPSKGPQILRKYVGHTGMVFNMLLNGNILYSISDDRSLRVWNFSVNGSNEDCTAVLCEFGHSARPFAIALGDNGSIFTAGIDQTVYEWKHINHKLEVINSYPLTIGCIRSLLYFNNQLYCGSDNGGFICISMTTASRTLDIINTCNDLRGFARDKDTLYTVNGRGMLFVNNEQIHSNLSLRYLVSSPLHIRERCIAAYGDYNIVVFMSGSQRIYKTKHRILSCVCNENFVLAYLLNKTAMLYDFSGSVYQIFVADALHGISKTKALIPSAIEILQKNDRTIALFGCVSGHLLFFSLDDEQIVAKTIPQINKRFHGNHITLIKKEGEYLIFLVKNIGIIRFKFISEDPFLIWLDTNPASTVVDLDMPSAFLHSEHEYLLAGFHSTDFRIVNKQGLRLFNFSCGGGNRPWNCFVDKEDEIVFEFIRQEKLVYYREKLKKIHILQDSLHKSQIIFMHTIISTNDYVLFCTGSTDTTMVFTIYHRSNKKCNIISRINDEAGIICVDSCTNRDFKYFVNGCGKGRIILWKLDVNELINTKITGLQQLHIFRFNDDIRVIDLHIEPYHMIVAVLLADGSIVILKIDEDKLSKIDYVSSPNLSLFMKVRWLSQDNILYLSAVSTSGKIYLWQFHDHKLHKEQEKLIAQCGLSAFDVKKCILVVGTESGEILKLKLENGKIIVGASVNYHNSTVTALRIDSDLTKIYSTSLDCRLASYNLSEEMSLNSVRSLTIWDPSSFILEKDFMAVAGSGLQFLHTNR